MLLSKKKETKQKKIEKETCNRWNFSQGSEYFMNGNYEIPTKA